MNNEIILAENKNDFLNWLNRIDLNNSCFRQLIKEDNKLFYDNRFEIIRNNTYSLARNYQPHFSEVEQFCRDIEFYRILNSLGMGVNYSIIWDGNKFYFHISYIPATYLKLNQQSTFIESMKSGLSLTTSLTKTSFNEKQNLIRDLNNYVLFTGQLTNPLKNIFNDNYISHSGNNNNSYYNIHSIDHILEHLSSYKEPISITIYAEPLPSYYLKSISDNLLLLASLYSSGVELNVSVSHSISKTISESRPDPTKKLHRMFAGMGKGAIAGSLAAGGLLLAPITAGLSIFAAGAASGAVLSADINDLMGWNATITKSETEQNTDSKSRKIINELNKFYSDKIKQLNDIIYNAGNYGLWSWYGCVNAQNLSVAQSVSNMISGRLSVINNNLEPITHKALPCSEIKKQNLEEIVTNFLEYQYMPVMDKSNGPTGFLYGSLARGEALPFLMAAPRKNFNGLSIIPHLTSDFKKIIENKDNEEITIGYKPTQKNFKIGISTEELKSHMLICGRSGSGKTNSLKSILSQIYKKKIPFVFLDFAQSINVDEWNKIADKNIYYEEGEDFSDNFPSLGIFDFRKPKEFDNYIWQISDLLANWIPSEGPLSLLLIELLQSAYKNYVDEDNYFINTDDYSVPKIDELSKHINTIFNNVTDGKRYEGELRSNLEGALKTRVKRLQTKAMISLLGGNSEKFFLSLYENKNFIVSLAKSGSTNERSFLGVLFLIKIRQWLRESQSIRKDKNDLRMVIALDEAHILLRKSIEKNSGTQSNIHSYSVKFFDELIAEIRQLGAAVIILDQSPSLLAESVLFCTANKLIFPLASGQDMKNIGESMGLLENDFSYFGKITDMIAYLKTRNSTGISIVETNFNEF